ncbi:hypothetical protein C3L33_04379, partial [Rhododendron williamsianum]
MARTSFSCASKATSTLILVLLIISSSVLAKKSKDVTELQIGVKLRLLLEYFIGLGILHVLLTNYKYKPESCDIQAHKGDRIKVHYRGKLTDGTVFDSSFERGDPIEFELGSGQVIKGWDQGLLGMCVGEKRKLKIPAKYGYGEQGSPPKIPGAELSQKLGVCYGQLGNNLPPPSTSLHLLKTLKASRVKLYDANPQILNALKSTGLKVSIMVPNELLANISANQTLADQWVRTNVSPFYPQVKIQYLLVGNEILSSTDNVTHISLVPAMRRIRFSLKSLGFKKIKVGTPLAMDVLESSFPPSNGTFRSEFSGPVVEPLLRFLNRTKSFFFLDVYTFFPWASDPVNIKLGYALLKAKNVTYTDPGTGLTYHNLLDQMLDAVIFAMKDSGIRISGYSSPKRVGLTAEILTRLEPILTMPPLTIVTW